MQTGYLKANKREENLTTTGKNQKETNSYLFIHVRLKRTEDRMKKNISEKSSTGEMI